MEQKDPDNPKPPQTEKPPEKEEIKKRFVSINDLVLEETKLITIFSKFKQKLMETKPALFLHPNNYQFQKTSFIPFFQYESNFPLKIKQEFTIIYDCLNFITYNPEDELIQPGNLITIEYNNNKANKENENNEINKEIKKNENKINKENKENIENENSEINKEIKEIKKNIINTHNNKENNETEGSKENINILAKNGEIKYIETKNKGVNKNFVGVDNICKEKSKGKNKKKETFCCL